MALSILDGTQTATTLSTILSGGQHITAHTVVSLGTQAITDMRSAVSGSVVSIPSLPAISGTVTANLGNVAGTPAGDPPDQAVRIAWTSDDALRGAGLDAGGEPLPIQIYLGNSAGNRVTTANPLPISGTVTIGSALPAGTNRIGVVTIGGGTVTIGAGTAQIGSVTASGTVTANIGGIANSVTLPVRLFAEKYGESPSGQDTLVVCNSNGMLLVDANVSGASVLGFDGNAFVQVKQVSGSSVTIGNSITISSLPSISGTVTANTFAVQGTAVTTSNFTSTTASTVLANFNATREVLTIFNEGAGNLHICAGATCTTTAYQVRLSAGDYYEAPNHQTSLTHSAVFATAGTARIVQIS